ncbi:MAG: hypothetical protein LBV21_03970 [Candidatus Adiutrix sp.]|jgi:hypothetical protein|nr:hypothetical protein [Candidatus Adiutrix sp.]
MSYLNALASDGLSVGLRIYSARLNSLSRAAGRAEVEPAASGRPETAAGAAEAEEDGRRVARPAPGQPPQTPEERAAGRAEAQAQLAAEGSLGQLRQSYAETPAPTSAEEPEDTPGATDPEAAPGQSQGPAKELSEAEKQEVQKLAQRDREVKAHEQAHVAASGGLAGSPHYEYQTGPDGRRYAVGGEVSVRRGGSSNVDQALREAEAVKRGAVAPAQPSSQDRAVAAAAEADLTRLRAEKTKRERAEKEAETGRPAEAGAESGPAAVVNGGPESPGELAPAFNGAGLGRQALGAYAAVKFGFAPARPVLARA